MANIEQPPKASREGHRQRMRKEFLSIGFNENTPDHRMLEFLLFYCVPRIDTNVLAHSLLNKYHTLAGVLDAPIEELMAFPYITETAATLLKLIMPVARKYLCEKQAPVMDFCSLDEVGGFLVSRFAGLLEERVAALFLNTAGGFLGFEFISNGSMDSVGISIKDLLKRTLEKNASVIVLAHNHPSGIALPSASDQYMTEMISETLAHVNIAFADHVVISGEDYVSMAQSSEYAHLFTKVF